MSERTARRLSWSIAVFSFGVVVIGLALSVLALAAEGRGVTFSHQFFTPVLTVTYCIIGALVASRQPRNPIGWMFCVTGLLSAFNMFASGYVLFDQLAAFHGELAGADAARWLKLWVWIPNVILPITLLLLLFPDGALISRRWRPIAWMAGLGIFGITFGTALHPGPLPSMGLHESNPFGIAGSASVLDALLFVSAPVLLVALLGSVASVIVRYRSSSGQARRQISWLAWAGVVMLVLLFAGGVPWLIWGESQFSEEFSIVSTSAAVAVVVLATGLAILRYQLWDIHILINRTLVYGLLTTAVIVIYVVIVGALGALLQTGGNLPVSLLGTGIVAISFQPLRSRLQRAVNRLMFGDRDDPYAVLGRLSQRLEAVAASQSVLPAIVETVAEAFKLPYTAVALKRGDGRMETAAEYGRAGESGVDDADLTVLPLIYQQETIGNLILAQRGPGEHFSQTDLRLLETIARQAGIAAYNVRLSQDLQRSRERIVSAREEERRRLRRDLHDGLGPVLAAMSFKLDAVHNLADGDPAGVKRLAAELKTQMQSALADIRRIAYGLRPPALDELGLVGALKEHIASQNQQQGLEITLEAPDSAPALPAAVEVAAYRIALEAMTNVSRHSGASHCCVRLSLPDDLRLEITDDGRGLPELVRAGVGLTSMRERAEELGGTCRAEGLPQGGTGVIARLPLPAGFAAAG